MEYFAAPVEWYWELFPRQTEVEEVVDLGWVARLSVSIIERAKQSGDSGPIGPAMHWAHRFVITQGVDGAWPAKVNLRTGEVVDSTRTLGPADFLEKLGDILNSSEFDRAVTRARESICSAEAG